MSGYFVHHCGLVKRPANQKHFFLLRQMLEVAFKININTKKALLYERNVTGALEVSF